ncbi:hypothetical protein BDZ90DRAFT_171730 [Jaminaea rosea]|uniref:Uncharacterized protein n=1 Tax=Jaminaea rosea TaxID=1569628 RepID=A0A316USL6_9BASI|nr:hypothetical protein BDZ90DRAFT_171730 [Jaminaea rosea]PWN27778.1 hypothetical protein BDZ90DRAFT_171730 [Jaminaea rosea]
MAKNDHRARSVRGRGIRAPFDTRHRHCGSRPATTAQEWPPHTTRKPMPEVEGHPRSLTSSTSQSTSMPGAAQQKGRVPPQPSKVEEDEDDIPLSRLFSSKIADSGAAAASERLNKVKHASVVCTEPLAASVKRSWSSKEVRVLGNILVEHRHCDTEAYEAFLRAFPTTVRSFYAVQRKAYKILREWESTDEESEREEEDEEEQSGSGSEEESMEEGEMRDSDESVGSQDDMEEGSVASSLTPLPEEETPQLPISHQTRSQCSTSTPVEAQQIVASSGGAKGSGAARTRANPRRYAKAALHAKSASGSSAPIDLAIAHGANEVIIQNCPSGFTVSVYSKTFVRVTRTSVAQPAGLISSFRPQPPAFAFNVLTADGSIQATNLPSGTKTTIETLHRPSLFDYGETHELSGGEVVKRASFVGPCGFAVRFVWAGTGEE